jgi:hypothetical protein
MRLLVGQQLQYMARQDIWRLLGCVMTGGGVGWPPYDMLPEGLWLTFAQRLPPSGVAAFWPGSVVLCDASWLPAAGCSPGSLNNLRPST